MNFRMNYMCYKFNGLCPIYSNTSSNQKKKENSVLNM